MPEDRASGSPRNSPPLRTSRAQPRNRKRWPSPQKVIDRDGPDDEKDYRPSGANRALGKRFFGILDVVVMVTDSFGWCHGLKV